MKSTWKSILYLSIILTAIISIMMTAFALPAVHSGINKIPVGVLTNNNENDKQIEETLANKGFQVFKYNNINQTTQDIKNRKIYGAFEVSSTGDVKLYEASAASYNVSQLISQFANSMVEQEKSEGQRQIDKMIISSNDVNTIKLLNQKLTSLNSKKAEIIDLKSFPDADPKGSGLAAGALPIALGGWIGAVAIASAVKGKRQKLAAIASFSLIGGFALVAVIQYGIGTFNGNFIVTALGAVLGIAATGLLVLGLLEVMGKAGLAVAALILIFLGNPLSGLLSAPEMLPAGWGAFGQLLPPGATGTLLRNIAFFDGNAIAQPLIVLLAYIIVGFILFKIGKKSELVEA